MSEQNQEVEKETIKKAVEEKYAAIARGERKSCCDGPKALDELVYNIATMVQGYNPA